MAQTTTLEFQRKFGHYQHRRNASLSRLPGTDGANWA